MKKIWYSVFLLLSCSFFNLCYSTASYGGEVSVEELVSRISDRGATATYWLDDIGLDRSSADIKESFFFRESHEQYAWIHFEGKLWYYCNLDQRTCNIRNDLRKVDEIISHNNYYKTLVLRKNNTLQIRNFQGELLESKGMSLSQNVSFFEDTETTSSNNQFLILNYVKEGLLVKNRIVIIDFANNKIWKKKSKMYRINSMGFMNDNILVGSENKYGVVNYQLRSIPEWNIVRDFGESVPINYFK